MKKIHVMGNVNPFFNHLACYTSWIDKVKQLNLLKWFQARWGFFLALSLGNSSPIVFSKKIILMIKFNPVEKGVVIHAVTTIANQGSTIYKPAVKGGDVL